MDECHICGQPAVKQAYVEGAKVHVCAECARYGKEVAKPPVLKGRVAVGAAPAAPLKELFPVDGYGEKIRRAREKMGMRPEDLAAKIFITKNELVHLEEERLKPAEKTARKLEKELNIALLVEKREDDGEKPLKTTGRKGGLTLADVVEIKSRK